MRELNIRRATAHPREIVGPLVKGFAIRQAISAAQELLRREVESDRFFLLVTQLPSLMVHMIEGRPQESPNSFASVSVAQLFGKIPHPWRDTTLGVEDGLASRRHQ